MALHKIEAYRPALARAYKKFGLAAAVKPEPSSTLSRVIVVYGLGDDPVGCAFFKCSRDFEIAVGRIMPYGIGINHPAYLFVQPVHDRWWVFAAYVDGSSSLSASAAKLLLVLDCLPDWIKVRKWHT